MLLTAIVVASMVLSQRTLSSSEPLGDAVKKEEVAAFYDAEMKANRIPRLPALGSPSSLEVGQVGAFRYSGRDFEPFVETSILSIVDESRCLVEVTVWAPTVVVLGQGAAGVGPPENRESFVLSIEEPTTGLVDGKRVRFAGAFEVVGTKSYVTAAGAKRTVYHLKPIDLPKPPKFEPKPEPAAKPVTPEKPADPLMRTWKLNSGKEIVGKFDRVSAANVRIVRENGQGYYLPIKELSEEDRKWLADQQKK